MYSDFTLTRYQAKLDAFAIGVWSRFTESSEVRLLSVSFPQWPSSLNFIPFKTLDDYRRERLKLSGGQEISHSELSGAGKRISRF